ncbi:MAG: hypothetical protein M3081_03520 [Gemmatimonadota bacterium]|nr:hypothetical protein [Gemmatimonadota bacterium]
MQLRSALLFGAGLVPGLASAVPAQTDTTSPFAHTESFERSYNRVTDRTQVRLSITNVVPGLDFTVATSYRGTSPRQVPDSVNIFVTQVGHTALFRRNKDLEFVLDNSTRVLVYDLTIEKKDVASFVVEQAAGPLPIADLFRIANAKQVDATFDRVTFSLSAPHMARLRDFVTGLVPVGPGSLRPPQ